MDCVVFNCCLWWMIRGVLLRFMIFNFVCLLFQSVVYESVVRALGGWAYFIFSLMFYFIKFRLRLYWYLG